MATRKPVPVHNLKVSRNGKVKKRSVFWRMRRVLYVATLALVVGASGLVYVLTQIDLPVDPRVASTQDQTSFICAADVQVNCNSSNAMAQVHDVEDRVLVDYEQIPDVLRQAVVAAEDRDFFDHGGVDPLGIARAALADIRNSGVRQGGSTITQQYVKQEYLTSEQTINRKIKEAVMAIKLEQQISKEEILTRYLNTVYFGRGAYGVQAASRAWFKHDISALDAGEAAFLAGLLRNPNSADPYRGPDSLREAERRRRVVLEAMWEEGYLTEDEKDLHLAVPIDPEDPSVDERDRFIKPPPKVSVLGDVKGAAWGSEYFAEHVRLWLMRQYGQDVVLRGGLRVYTTIDLGMQKHAYDAVTQTLDREGDPAGALVAIDDEGRVRAMMGGTDFANRPLNLTTGTGRPTGSTFKGFALAHALREGYSVQSILPSPMSTEFTEVECTRGGDPWKVRGGPGGSSSLVTATKNSINTTYAELVVRLGPDAVRQTAVDMGVKGMADQDAPCAMVLGSQNSTVLDLAAGYSTFANEGIAKDPVVVTRVEFPDGRVDNFEAEEREVLTPVQAARATHAFRQVIDGGTGSAASIGRPAAGKTGTTQKNADAWFVGYTPTLTAAVWIGYPDAQLPMDDVHGVKVQGGNLPAEVWQKFMSKATEGTEVVEFPEISAQELAEGEVLDSSRGKTSYVAEGNTAGDTGGNIDPSQTTTPPAAPPPSAPTPSPTPTTEAQAPPSTEAPPPTSEAPPATEPDPPPDPPAPPEDAAGT